MTLLVAVFHFEANLQMLWIQPHNNPTFWESNPVFYFVIYLYGDFEFFFLEVSRRTNPGEKHTTPINIVQKNPAGDSPQPCDANRYVNI